MVLFFASTARSSLRNLIVKVPSHFAQLVVAQMAACCRANILCLGELLLVVRLEEKVRGGLVLEILLLAI